MSAVDDPHRAFNAGDDLALPDDEPAPRQIAEHVHGTVRGWMRRFAGRAEPVRVFFTALVTAAGPDPVMPAAAGSPVADAVAAIAGAAAAVAARWPELGEVPVWQAASAASGGLLLAPGWPPAGCNTS